MIELIVTKDGSHTIFDSELGVWHHSVNGALQESTRIFIELGLLEKAREGKEIKIFEMGFGTGLNVLLTLIEARKHNYYIDYTTLEAFPLPAEKYEALNYDLLLDSNVLQQLHQLSWNQKHDVMDGFSLTKIQNDLLEYRFAQKMDLVYFDAYSPNTQPELWTEEVFRKIYDAMNTGGVLMTYCSKTVVRKTLLAAGFNVEKHPGPRGKREVLRAIKV
ncbi:tRNA (5-methylaminomethyl-2-thiouridine)(34)-methyltransferase MnmD [Flectobacillus sp. DC10W]|jgi:tRNA U34 5-methylaminomethyl-2-thiouridine-forming methyltransferase MnmC|uniref:tRNA (5-methylaminomethyl-2-thiouridine)(34)-methyltransferase MnmD n=1 Tax=Flectobacillus longus TaxID=2984207 RepID=A0ABT6YRB2_9BACT|nr:tRNA (5-methylaminomethyl-2-thiouridine)(34)-methyltransferase MnmD [Flectobacillus longus]MDI9866118.1 tRNA (5-methylaminomethyl-2-thiouridine)(34)-methyltransferase MnmD [Flectobacillus longus]